ARHARATCGTAWPISSARAASSATSPPSRSAKGWRVQSTRCGPALWAWREPRSELVSKRARDPRTRRMGTVTGLLTRIEQRKATVGIIGLGYVGLPLATEFAQAGFQVVGFDIDSQRVAALNKGICHIPDVDDAVFEQLVTTGQFRATVDFSQLTD